MEGQRVQKIWEPIDFTIYFKFIRWPVLVALLVEVVFRYFVSRLESGILVDQVEIISWLIRITAFVIIARRSIKTFGYSAAVAAISGVMSGFVVGFIVSLYRFGSGINLWKFFNIITETTIVTIVGSLVAIFVVYVSSIKK